MASRKKPEVDETGTRAEHLGTLYGASGAMFLSLLDAPQVLEWPGWEGWEDGRANALLENLEQTSAAVQADAGGAGWVSIWKIDGGLALLEYYPDDDVDPRDAKVLRRLGYRVAQLPSHGKIRSEGLLNSNGALALVLPYTNVDELTARQLSRAPKAKKVVGFDDGHGALVALEAGSYEVFHEQLGKDGYEDELGLCETRIRIVPATAAAKRKASKKAKATKAAATKAPGKFKVDHDGQAPCWGKFHNREPLEFWVADAQDASVYDANGHWDRASKEVFQTVDGQFFWEGNLGGTLIIDGKTIVFGQMGCGDVTTMWQLPNGVGFLDLDPDKKVDLSTKGEQETLGKTIAQIPSVESQVLGQLKVTSGAVCIAPTMATVSKASARVSGDRPKLIKSQGLPYAAAIPLENGTYTVVRDLLGTERSGRLTESGRVYIRVRIVRGKVRGATEAKTRGKPNERSSKNSKTLSKTESPKVAKGTVRLELSAGSSHKFWEVSVKASEMTVRYGRIGTNGQSKTKSFESPAAAKAERDKLVASKKRKGYR